jgi:ATP-dependent Clp protease ATP-binding subunit ClpB
VLSEIEAAQGQIILFIDEMHTLVGAGKADGAMDASNLLKPALARGELHCVGATTLDEYRKHVEKDAALARRFQPVYVPEPSVEDTISILRGLKEKYELHHGVRISDAALVTAATLSNRYITDRIMQLKIEREALKKEKDSASKDRLAKLEKEIVNLEEKANALGQTWRQEKEKLASAQKLKEQLDAARIELEQAQRRGDLAKAGELAYGVIPDLEAKLKKIEEDESKGGAMAQEVVTPDLIAGVVSRWTGIPVDKMLEGEREKLLQMETQIAKRVVGQQEAVEAVSTAVRRSRAGLQDPNRPIGSFMFLGPTGVGKTELSRALAEFMFDDEHAMIRIDMSEYMEKHSVARLIGAPPGYVGYEEGGALTEAVRRRPYQVILFDEIEKAHPDVFNVLLQVLDDGRLTDGQGRTVDFRNTLIIMTSNLGSEYLVNQPEGEDIDQVREQVMNVVRSHFRPEFLNRVDEIILFHRLKREDMGQIVDIQLGRLMKLLADRKITLQVDDKAKDWLGQKGYDPAYGARPLKRVIQKYVQDPLAEMVLAGKIHDGETVKISAGKDGLMFNGAAAKAKAA